MVSSAQDPTLTRGVLRHNLFGFEQRKNCATYVAFMTNMPLIDSERPPDLCVRQPVRRGNEELVNGTF